MYGTAEIDGDSGNLKVIGGPGVGGGGKYLTTVREYDDNTITDRCCIDRHYLTVEDEDGTKYATYAISEHYQRYIDRTKMLDETKAATEINFVAPAETGGIDGTTPVGKHKICRGMAGGGLLQSVASGRRYGESLPYRCVQQHTTAGGMGVDKAVSLWSVAERPCGGVAGMEPAALERGMTPYAKGEGRCRTMEALWVSDVDECGNLASWRMVGGERMSNICRSSNWRR